ncbi:response regulator transcription factor [Nocardioides rubriscoriae]|uniref:response regulator transcription factor n=1 Tax=Nocardioides rubriscoriae TaxID=642762 RepID=UPI001FE41558|nr:response regulator transcription factor [Nocardioides rubriscoriae]
MTESLSRVAIVSPLDIVATGLAAMLDHHPDQVRVVGLPAGFGADDPDVILYDAIGLHEGDGSDLETFVKDTSAAVLVVSQDLRPDLASRALARGADGFFSLGVDDEQLLRAVLSATSLAEDDGSVVVTTRDQAVEHRLGHDVGLTPREIDVLTLITQGLSNQEIAEQSYLSINSVKTYIRSAYRRIGVTSRSQAVVWCLQHGFAAEPAS